LRATAIRLSSSGSKAARDPDIIERLNKVGKLKQEWRRAAVKWRLA